MDFIASQLGLLGGPLLILLLGFGRARSLGGDRMRPLLMAAGLALAVNVALGLVTAALYVPASEVVDEVFTSFDDGTIFVSPVSLIAMIVIAQLAHRWLQGLGQDSRFAALPAGDSLPLVAGALVLAAAGFLLTGRGGQSIPLGSYVFLSLFVFGLYWPMLSRALERHPEDRSTPWRTIIVAAAVGLNPLPELWDALRTDGATLTPGMLAWMISQAAFLVLLGFVRARVPSVPAVFIVALGSHALALAAARSLG